MPSLRLECVRIHHLRLPLRFPFETSFGRETEKDTVIVTVAGEGLTGYGEAPVHGAPRYNHEDALTVIHVLRDFMAPAMVGRTFTDPAQLPEHPGGVRGHRFARAALELALADWLARAQGVSLARFWGGAERPVPVGVSLGIEASPEALLDRVAAFVDAGYGRVKLKIKPGWDVEVLRAVRARFPELMLFADANGAYRLRDAPHLVELDRFSLTLLEQPLAHDELVDHARLRRRLRTPLCLDESLAGWAVARAALRLGAVGAVNIKIPRMGGARAARRLARLAARLGLPVFMGGMLESGIGRAHNLALATLPAFTLPGDLSASDRYYAVDLVEPPFRLGPGGTLTPPRSPGLGVEVVTDRVAAFTVARWEVRP